MDGLHTTSRPLNGNHAHPTGKSPLQSDLSLPIATGSEKILGEATPRQACAPYGAVPGSGLKSVSLI